MYKTSIVDYGKLFGIEYFYASKTQSLPLSISIEFERPARNSIILMR